MATVGTEVWIGLIAFIAGIFLIAGAAFRKQVGWNINPVFAMVIGVSLAVFGGAFSIPALIGEEEEVVESGGTVIVQPQDTTPSAASFDITPVNGSAWIAGENYLTFTVADDEQSGTMQVNQDGTNTFDEEHGSVNFTIDPIAAPGVDNNDLCTIYFEVDETLKYSGEYVFDESSNDYDCDWRVNGASTVDNDGTHTMLYTDTAWVEFRFILESGTANEFADEFDTVGESMTIPVTFHNVDWSWSWTFDIDLIVITNA